MFMQLWLPYMQMLFRSKRLIKTSILFVCSILFQGCESAIEINWPSMGTIALVRCDEADVLHARDEIRVIFDEIEAELSPFRQDSYLTQYNRGEKSKRQALHFEALRQASEAIITETNGAFNPCMMPIMKAWGFNQSDRPIVPPSLEQLTLLLVACQPHSEGAQFDFGGIAKGYAVRYAADHISTPELLIGLGGSYYAKGRAFSLSVRDPYNHEDVIGSIQLPAGFTVSTSGNYEKQIEILGKYYTHIIDPRTGWPIKGIDSMTVMIKSDGARADACATALMVMGDDERINWLRTHPEVSVLWIANKTIYMNAKMKSFFVQSLPSNENIYPIKELL